MRSENVLITFVSKDLELNRVGIRKLIVDHEYGNFSKVYLLYHKRLTKRGYVKGWDEMSVKNKDKIANTIRSLKVVKKEVAIDVNNIIPELTKIFVKEHILKNTIYLDATSLRRITIAQISFFAAFLDLKIFLVIPKNLYDPRDVFIKIGNKYVPLTEWSSEQTGSVKLVDIPNLGCPSLKDQHMKIIDSIKSENAHDVDSILSCMRSDLKESRLREGIRRLKNIGVINYKMHGRHIYKIELTLFGKVLSQILKSKTQ